MKKLLFLMMALLSVILFTGCPVKEPEHIDLGSIPEKYLATVPYADGDVFYLQHESDRVVIPFHVTRTRSFNEGSDFYDYGMEKMKPAPSVYFHYEVDYTVCRPDYPLFDIEITLSNGYMADSVYYQQSVFRHKYAHLACHGFYASIPFIGEPADLFTVHDSLEVNGHTYYDVFEFANQGQDRQGVSIQTAYFNYEKGVIALKMSNGEKYMLYEEE